MSPEQMVYETEGRHGGDIRGWHGEQARREAEEREHEEWLRHEQECAAIALAQGDAA